MDNKPSLFPLRDERTVAVENASYKHAYVVLLLGCMIDVIVRGLIYGDGGWDLMGLIIVSSTVATIYQRVKRVQLLLPWRLKLIMLLGGTVGGVAFAVAAVLLSRHWHP